MRAGGSFGGKLAAAAAARGGAALHLLLTLLIQQRLVARSPWLRHCGEACASKDADFRKSARRAAQTEET